jgi:hypothetical protein
MIAQSLSGGQPKMRAYDPAAAIIKPERLIETTSSLIHHIQKSGSGILPELFRQIPLSSPTKTHDDDHSYGNTKSEQTMNI